MTIFSLTFIATGCFGFVTGVETGIHIVVETLVKEVMDGLGVETYGGTGLLVILWVKLIFMVTSSTVWILKWHNARYVVRERAMRAAKRPVEMTASSTYPRSMERIVKPARIGTTI